MYGREIVEQLPKLLAEQSEQARQNCAKHMGDSFRLAIEGSIQVGEALKVFEIYRKFDLRVARSGQNSTEEELKASSSSLIGDLASTFQAIPQGALRDYVDNNWHVYKEERAALFAARSQASHVESVLKPFQRKFFDRFISAIQNDDARPRYEGDIGVLLNANCDEYLDLRDWWDRVWNLFFDLAVYKKESPSEKVVGMIGQGSVRTYRQQWRSWFKANSGLLLKTGIQRNMEAMVRKLEMPAIAEGVNFSHHKMATESPKEIGEVESVTIDVELDADDSLRLARTWPRLDDSVENDILRWLNKVEPLLDAKESKLQIKLVLKHGLDTMESSFSSTSAPEAAQWAGKTIGAFISSL